MPRVETDPPVRGFWLDEALQRQRADIEPLDNNIDVDVCIIGGGYTGLWTALALKQRSPGTSVAVVDADICGGGASGRNGGMVMTWWTKFASLQKMCGREAALELCRRSQDAVAAIGSFCADNVIDAGFEQSGWLWAATNPTQVGAWDKTLTDFDAAGVKPFERMDRDAVAAVSGSASHLAGVFDPHTATVQPALLARGLREVALRRGVQIYERTPVTGVEATSRCKLRTPRGSIDAHRVILATNAWSAGVSGLGRSIIAVSSDVIATAPMPERLEATGWVRGMAIADSRRLVNYYRTTDDGRVVFGKGGGSLAFRGRITPGFMGSSPRVDELRAQMRQALPAFWDAPVASSWRGPIDYSVSGLPFVAPVGRPDIVVAAGFSGNGVGPSYVIGELLAELTLDERAQILPEPLMRPPTGGLPPEPIRYAGGLLVRAAIASKERAEDLGRRPNPLSRALAAMDPTSNMDLA